MARPAAAHQTLTDQQYAALRLARTSGIGPVRYFSLIERCGTPSAALAALPELSRGKLTPAPTALIEAEIAATAKLGGQLIFFDDAAYPELLKHIPDPPPVLAVLGDCSLLHTPQLAIVGTRNASANGQRYTHQLAQELAGHGFTITSGLARGIDTAAHHGALAANGKTIAILGGGLDHIYPPQNKDLFTTLTEQGAIVAETPIGTAPTASSFPRRNRLIAGLSHGVLVVEAARHSGSLITAQYAGEQGREVMAIPGHPADPRAAGPNHLLRQGATLVTSADEIREALAQFNPSAPPPRQHYVREDPAPADDFLAPEDMTVPTLLDLLSPTPTPLDDLTRRLNLTPAQLLAQVVELELEGRVQRLPGGLVALT